MLFECEGNEEQRNIYWAEVKKCCPERLFLEIEQMTNEQKTSFILNGLNNAFTIEWMEMYSVVANFIYMLIITRYNEE